ncbi:MAG: hypothetical protein GXY83_42135 [Rhodopirellula sp.]|nr:hypothetical protein [Rhodopirellula sp.]
MAKRRNKPKTTISLFPFLSILACVIGVLTLMITAMALGQMDTDSFASIFEFEQVRSKIEQAKELIRKLQAEIAKQSGHADATQQELADARLQLDQLLLERENLQKTRNDPVEVDLAIPQVDAAAHEQRLAQMREEITEQTKTKEELLAELKKRDKPPEEAQVIIQPGGSGSDLKPTFVECTASDVVIYQGAEPERVRRADLAGDEKFLGLLRRVAAQPDATIIFLVRDDALGTYYAARDVAQAHFARNGKLPVIGHGKIDLSLFQK